MAKAKVTAEPQGLEFALPDSVKVFLNLLVQAGAQALLDWLNRKSDHLMAAAKEQVRAEVTEQVRAEVAAKAQDAPASQA